MWYKPWIFGVALALVACVGPTTTAQGQGETDAADDQMVADEQPATDAANGDKQTDRPRRNMRDTRGPRRDAQGPHGDFRGRGDVKRDEQGPHGPQARGDDRGRGDVRGLDGDRGREDFRGRGNFRGRHVESQLFEGIELTDEQREQVKQVRTDVRQQRQAWFEENREKLGELRRQSFRAIELGDREAATEARALFDELAGAAPQVDDAEAQVREVLTAEQQALYDANKAEMQVRVEAARQEMQLRQQEMNQLRERWRERDQQREGEPGDDSDDQPGDSARNRNRGDRLDI